MESTYGASKRSTVASVAHLSALTGPLVPWAISAVMRRSDRFSAGEAAKAGNFAFALVAVGIAAFLVSDLAPLVGFVGTLAQWTILVVAVYFCVSAAVLTGRGRSATYPFQFKVVKTYD